MGGGSLPSARATISAPAIKSTILDSGTVLVYVKGVELGDPSVYMMPHILTTNLGDIVNYSFSLSNGTIGFIVRYIVNSSGAGVGDLATFIAVPDLRFRYIVIPGGVKAARMRRNIDYSNYAEVCRMYGIKKP